LYDKISLNPKLAVFTVIGSSEPRVVRLFPTASCSCPARAQCYHITAARLAVGAKDNEKRRPLNLTQLRRNKRKRCDKVSGRKRPRADDVDVVAAADADPDVAEQLLHTINDGQTQDDVEPDDPQTDDTPAADDVCQACKAAVPPPRKGRRPKNSKVGDGTVNWVECESCGRWYHYTCVGFTGGQFLCDFC